MRGNIGNLMKQAQQMQANLKKAQDELATVDVEGTSGGGMVKVVMSCRNDVRSVKLDPALLEDDDVEVLEDLIAAAVNDAVRKAEETTKERMASITGGMNIPGMNMPF